MNRFCVRCGKQTEALIDSLCSVCYLEKHEVISLPDNIKLDFDWRSDKLRIGRNWLEKNDKVLSQFVSDSVISHAKAKRFEIAGLEIAIEAFENNAIAHVSFVTFVEGVKLPIKKDMNISFRKTISDASMKISSYYHEAIIQVRF